MWEVKGVLKWRHAVHREIRENEAREPFRGGRHPYWYPGETECSYIPVNWRKDLGTVFKICQGKRRGVGRGGGEREWSIQIAAKLLLVNIDNTETSKEYASGAKVADLAANLDYIPPSLLVCFCFLFFVVAVAGEERTWSQNSFSG